MATKTGYYVTAGDTAQALTEANRSYEGYKTWRKMYGAIDLNAQRQMSKLQQQYDTGIAAAYNEAYKARQAIANSSYFDTYKEQLTKDVDTALENAYSTYLQNYAAGVSSIEEEKDTGLQAINEALSTKAKNTAQIASLAYDYTKENVENYLAIWDDDEQRKNLLSKGIDLESPEWKRFIYTDPVSGERRMKTWSELESGDDNTEGFFTTEGTDKRLSQAGIDFYDFVLNNPYYTSSQSFEGWLRENYRDLYDWYTSTDQYNYAPGKRGENTNATSFRQFIGLEPSDVEYGASERGAGLTTKQIDKKITEIEAITDIGALIQTRDELQSMKNTVDEETYNKLLNSVNKAETKAYESYVQAAGVTQGNSPTIKFTHGTNGILKNDNTTVTIGKQENAVEAATGFKRGQAFLYKGKPYLSDGQGHMYHVRDYAGSGAYERLQKLLRNTVYDIK